MKALVMVSGGPDSRLALEVLRAAGVDVVPVHFRTGFNHAHYSRQVANAAATSTEATRIEDLHAEYLRKVALPLADEGLDPCHACRSLMLGRAAAMAAALRCDVLATGDVIGQHAHTQSRTAMARAERDAGVAGRVSRPLSSAFLPDDPGPEPALLAGGGRLQGRSRRQARELARTLGVTDVAVKSGGCCRLRDPRFLTRLRDARGHEPLEAATATDLELLATGRQFRLASRLRVIVARDAGEGARLLKLAGDRTRFQVESGRGAVALAIGDVDAVGHETLGGLAVRYSAERAGGPVRVVFRQQDRRRIVSSRSAPEDDLDAWRI